ncbi:hypothetical protein QAD02_003654 [Eretmocerus hayati]|uniref:Uncharacterized protein n=1 Tax=Eretmocerus hayati TaxID=131215 RepID=A0ACC2NMI9_9HYME|nr:hypothetical protein QAD02_003654 [Eretmocerus hayati]
MTGHASEVGDASCDAGAGTDSGGKSELETQTIPKKRGRPPKNKEGSASEIGIPKGHLVKIEKYLVNTRASEKSVFDKSLKIQHSPVKGSVAASASITEEGKENGAAESPKKISHLASQISVAHTEAATDHLTPVDTGRPRASDPADRHTNQEGETAGTLYRIEQLFESNKQAQAQISDLKSALETEKKARCAELTEMKNIIAELKEHHRAREEELVKRIEELEKRNPVITPHNQESDIQTTQEYRESQNTEDPRNPDTNSHIAEWGQDSYMTDRRYLRHMPDCMGNGEYEYEMKERKKRKRNIIMRGTRTVGKFIREEVERTVWDIVRLPIHIRKITPIGGGLVIELQSFYNKMQLMKVRRKLESYGICISDEYTEREKEINNWVQGIAEEERENGLEARAGYMKIYVQGYWYNWDEKKGRLVSVENKKPFRDQRTGNDNNGRR